jgi:quercetin dioxygenase-like cupin family protein
MQPAYKGFVTPPIRNGLLCADDDERFKTLVFGFVPNESLDLPADHTHFGFVLSGEITVIYPGRRRQLQAGDFFSVLGAATVASTTGEGIVTSAQGYVGLNVFGGEVETRGRLRYIDGCTDTLLVPPVRKGDPCLNYLHFPKDVSQTSHTHPSVRAGIVYRGEGECVLPGVPAPIPLRTGDVFVIRKDTVHSFNTTDATLDLVLFHPDSDAGITDDDHPMLNRTIVDGVSARSISRIRTLADV